jgi:hypothetical protein
MTVSSLDETPVSFLNEIISSNVRQESVVDNSDTLSTISTSESIFNQRITSKNAPPFSISSEGSFTFIGPSTYNNLPRRQVTCYSEGNISDSISVLTLNTQGSSKQQQKVDNKEVKLNTKTPIERVTREDNFKKDVNFIPIQDSSIIKVNLEKRDDESAI